MWYVQAMNLAQQNSRPVNWRSPWQHENHGAIRQRILRLAASIVIRIKTPSFRENVPSACHSRSTISSPVSHGLPQWALLLLDAGGLCQWEAPARSQKEEGKWGQNIFFSSGYPFCRLTLNWLPAFPSRPCFLNPLYPWVCIGSLLSPLFTPLL